HQREVDAALEALANPSLPRSRPEPEAVVDRVHALGQGAEAAPSLHQDWRPEAREGVCDAFRVGGQGAIPSPRLEGEDHVTVERPGSRRGCRARAEAWLIGERIIAYEQEGEDRAAYGEGLDGVDRGSIQGEGSSR